MSDLKSVHQYYTAIKDRLKNYIKADYLANSETLLGYADDILDSWTSDYASIVQEPYIETSSSYKKCPNGIQNSSSLDSEIKHWMSKLAENGLGVFQDPFKHQVDALERFFEGRDLFVSTGQVPERRNVFCGRSSDELSMKQKRDQRISKNKAFEQLSFIP